MALLDTVTLQLSAGNGGNGVERWIREKYKPKAGPGGGNGGNGGDVVLEAVGDVTYLKNYRFKKKLSAQHGQHGKNQVQHGKNGEDIIVRIPVGSRITNTETGEYFDMLVPGEKHTLLRGGRGGLGNHHFRSSTNVSPTEWTPGKDGQYGTFVVELRLIADIGLVGLPSAGKSTMLNALTNARAKTGAYHFTTLEPNLGVMKSGHVLADIPGIIQGASAGKGLGHLFLRHITRTPMLAFVVGLDDADPHATYQTLVSEIAQYGQDLESKPRVIVLTKTDLLPQEDIAHIAKDMQKKTDIPVHTYSAYDDATILSLGDFLSEHIAQYTNQ